MANTFAHVSCGFVGGRGRDLVVQSVIAQTSNSQTFTGAGTTSFAAPSTGGTIGEPCFTVSAAVEVYVAVGKPASAVDPTQVNGTGPTARVLVRAGETVNLFCQPGDYLSIAAS